MMIIQVGIGQVALAVITILGPARQHRREKGSTYQVTKKPI
jgi:hypothetical protein